MGIRKADQHLRDLGIPGGTAREASLGKWTLDLARSERSRFEQDPTSVPWGPVTYWWPDPRSVKDSKTMIVTGAADQSGVAGLKIEN
jgi:hypothetical protein